MRRRLRARAALPARLHGCLLGLAFCDGDLAAGELAAAASAQLNPGADPELIAAFMLGLLQAAPDVLLHTPELVTALNQALGAMDTQDFLGVLPDLRRAFTWLKPSETARLAALLAQLTGARPGELDAVLDLDPAMVERATLIEREVASSLVRDQLSAWVGS